ncbi:MAG: SEC-C domain-containing protein [Clostridia bacterium]|nr:SEC-C domain-containing protein [Clostridia bacterium]
MGAENGINSAVVMLVKFDSFSSKVAILDRYCTNDPCSCGSGKKYKKCCQFQDEEKARLTSLTTTI